MKIIITESQYKKIIKESSLDTIKNLIPKDKPIKLTSELPQGLTTLTSSVFNTPESFVEGLRKTNLNFDAFPKTSSDLNFRNPLSFTGSDDKGNRYTFSFTPTQNFLNLTIRIGSEQTKKISR